MSSTRKPVIIRKWTRDWCAGYTDAVPSSDSPELELLDNSGKIVRMPWESVKWVCYVRDFQTASGSGTDKDSPERMLRRRFAHKPRVAGLWLRLVLSDGEELEGVATNDRTLIEGNGLLLTPPDIRSNTQRVFIPRTAIREFTILGVVPPANTSARTTPGLSHVLQPGLFTTDPSANEDR